MNQVEKLIDIAFSQIGYHEGEDNYTKYGEWFGIPNGEWCDMFVCWCANQSGISENIIPKLACCDDTGEWYDARKLYQNSYSWGGSYIPKRGDLILFDWDRSRDSDHIGIVVSVSGNKVRTIEGNKDNQVKECEYDLGDRNIRAYCTPQYEDKPVPSYGKYLNGSTKEPVYSDTDLSHYIGYLNAYEECDCLGIFNDRPIVRYNVDGTNNYKIGFVEWQGGVC